MKKEKIYELKQSVFEERIINYYLCENDSKYGIEIMIETKNENEISQISNISKNKNFVVTLIKHLYENAIDTIHFKDVVDDYLALTQHKV